MLCPRCEENGQEVELELMPVCYGDKVMYDVWVCPVCNYDSDEEVE